jgi:phage repressor protein C with HTH and peptisase S24 domain
LNGISEITIKEFLLWLLRKRKRMRVTGNSMLPLFKPGEEILINPQAYKKSLPKIGDVVVTFTHS